MSDEVREEMNGGVLDRNLGRLIAVAPERARLDTAERERLTAALRAHVLSETAHRGPHAPSPGTPPARPARIPRHRAGAFIAVAAAAALVVLLLRGWAPNEGDAQTTADGGAESLGTADGPQLVAANGGEDGAKTVATGGTDLDPPPVAGANGGHRTAAGADQGVDAPRDGVAETRDQAPTGSIRALLSLDASIKEFPAQITVWVKPQVHLPQVADPLAHTVTLAHADGEARTATFVLSGALEPARAMGVTEVLVQIEAPGAAPARAVATLEQLADSALTFAMTAGSTVEGFVVDARTGTPLTDAFVVALSQLPLDAISVAPSLADGIPRPYATTNANGAFALHHVRPGDDVQIRASHAGFAPSIKGVHVGPAAPSSVRLELPQGGVITGLVDHPDGTRWEGALVIASTQASDPTVGPREIMTAGFGTTDATGTYRIEDLPGGAYVVLLFGKPTSETPAPLGFTQAFVKGTAEETVNFLAPTSAQGPSFAGRLIDETGTPVVGATLTLVSVREGVAFSNDWSATDTSEDGSFTFAEVESGRHALYRATESFARLDLLWTGTIDGALEHTIAMPGTDWSVACNGAIDGDPRQGAWVIVETFDLDTAAWLFAARGTTDEGGVIMFPHLPPGRYRGTVSGTGAGNGHARIDPVELFAGTATDTAVALPNGGTLTVRVFDGPNGAPVEGARLKIEDADGLVVPEAQPAITDRLGLARSHAVTYGDVTLTVRSAKGARTVVSLRFRAGGPGQAEPLDIIVNDD